MVTILIMSTKIATLDLSKIKVLWDYDVMVYVHDTNNKMLSRDSNYIVDVVMSSMFGNSSISMREVIIISFF